jgi:hypothetical protein
MPFYLDQANVPDIEIEMPTYVSSSHSGSDSDSDSEMWNTTLSNGISQYFSQG